MLTSYLNPTTWKSEPLPQEIASKVTAFCTSNKAHPYSVQPEKLQNGLSGWRLHYARNRGTKKHSEHYTYFYS